MDHSDVRPSPRQEMQLKGPRPSPLSLKVSKDSHRIRKPLTALPHHHPSAEQPPPPPPPPPPPHRDPVIIYSVSPKVIHADPTEFMALVQKLTGPSSAAAAAAEAALSSPGAALSPAARIASFEKSSPRAPPAAADLEPALFSGILSPMPAELPPISPNLFSPSASDPSFSLELSPAFANKNLTDNWGNNSSLISPSYNLPSTPTVPSPEPSGSSSTSARISRSWKQNNEIFPPIGNCRPQCNGGSCCCRLQIGIVHGV